MANPKGLGKGALIRGADGALYFVPEKILQGFRLDAKKTAEAIKKCDELGIRDDKIQEGDILPAFFADDLAFLEGEGEFFMCVVVNMIKLPAFARRPRK